MGLTQKLGTIPLAILTDASNNVGIGAAPSGSYKLEVTGTIRGTGSAFDFYTSSGLGTSSASGLMRVITSGTSVGIAIGQSNSTRYTAIAANDYKIYNDDFFLTTNGAFPLSLGTNNTARLTISSTGVATFSNNVVTSTYFNANNSTRDFYFNSSADLGFGPLPTIQVASAHALQFATNNIKRMEIASNGAVGINANATANIVLFPRGFTSGTGSFTIAAQNSSSTFTFILNDAGNVTISGSLSKGSGSFRIDHPLESLSETHQLVHSFIEGPQADLIYRGKLTLVNGKAQANIDEVSTMTNGTFEALCREVQCFTTNESGWDLVKGKVIGNIIYIESQNTSSSDEISWMVIGERKDKHMMDTDWTDDNGKIIVEPLKPSEPIVEPKN